MAVVALLHTMSDVDIESLLPENAVPMDLVQENRNTAGAKTEIIVCVFKIGRSINTSSYKPCRIHIHVNLKIYVFVFL